MKGTPYSHDEHDLDLPSDCVQEISPAAALALDPVQIVPSEDGRMDPATEAAHSTAIEPNIDFTSNEVCVIGSHPGDGSCCCNSLRAKADRAIRGRRVRGVGSAHGLNALQYSL